MNDTRIDEINNCGECKHSVFFRDTLYYCHNPLSFHTYPHVISYDNCPLPTKSQYIQQQIKEALGDDDESS